MKDHLKARASILALVLLLLSSATGLGATTGQKSLYIVLLSQPSLAEKLVRETPGMSWAERREMLSGKAANDYRKELSGRQEAFVRTAPLALRRSGGPTEEPLEVTHRTTLLLNSLLVRMTSEEARRMSSMEGVAGVYPNGRVEMAMDAVPQFLGAPAAWERVGGSSMAGAGMRIGIIDSGIDISHPMFQDPTLMPPPALPAPTEFESFTNEKVIAARNYVRGQYDLNNENTAEDLVGHGSIVAGIAAGAPVEAPLGPVSGIAPRAFLGNYRVFGDPSQNRFATDGAVIAALEDAVNDGMDVVNLSLGGPARNPSQDPQQIAIAEAVDLGVVVVIASGNGGSSGAGSVMSPGTSPVAITVGSVSHPRVFGLPLEISSTDPSLTVPEELGRFLQVPGLRTPDTHRFGPLPIVSIQSFDASGRACDPLPVGSLEGKFALVRRGVCFFSIKADHVLNQAGAAGMVVYNDVGGAPFSMDLGEETLTKPAVMIDLRHGEELRQLLLTASQAGKETAIEALIGSEEDTSPFPGEPDLLLNFSGRGPTGGLGIKPDLVAPGDRLYTAAIGSSGDGGFAFTNPDFTAGTSFSTPMVSGAAALLEQLHPDWTPDRIKSALVSSASRTVRFNGRAALPTEAGGGRLDLAKATATEVLVRVLEDGSPQASSVDLAFGSLDAEAGGERQLVLELTNLGVSAKDLTIGLENQAQVATVDWEPSSLHLEPGAVGTVNVSARLSGTPGNFEGFMRIRDALGGTDLAVPYFGVATVRGEGRTLRVSSSPEDFGSPSTALGVALPGDVIELAEDAEYSTPLEISRNLAGVKLDGLTVRAAPGVHPVLNVLDSDTLSQPVIRVLGLERVTIEGLTIRSRSLGIEYVNSGGIIRDNRILMEDGEGDLPDAIRLENSRVHLYGNSISGSNRDGVSLEDSESLAQANAVDASRRHGFFFNGAEGVALFDNWIHESRGDGVLSVQSTLLAKGNLVSGGALSEGDGVRAEGSSSRLLLRDNLISGSGTSGVALAEGAEASLLGDEISFNGGSGLLLDASTAQVESARFFSNATAIRAISGELDLRNSLLAGSETGSGLVMEEGALVVDHSTIANNAASGIEAGSLSRFEVANTVLHGNAAGDVTGSGGLFRFSLFEGMAPDGIGNQTGDPGFINAADSDFTLGPGSAAIDGGDPEQPEGSSDLFFHTRIVDGNDDGAARTDIGAIEAGSANAPPIVLPILAANQDNFVGLAMVNAYTPASLQQQSIVSSQVRLQAYDTGGRPQANVYDSDILPGRQLAVLLQQDDVLGPLMEGWVEILPTQRDLMAFSLVGGYGLSFLDGAQLTSIPSKRLLFPEVRGNGENTWIFLVNPHHDVDLRVRLIWNRSPGSVTEVSLELPPLGMISDTFHDLFGVGNGGYLVAEADRPFFGLELFGDASTRRAGLLAIDLDRSDQDLYGAQLASNSQIETTVHVINLGMDNAQVVLTAHGENGAALVSVSRILQGRGDLRLDARDLFGFNGDVVGWIEVHSDSPVAGSVTFGDPDGRFLASLPLQSQGAREFFLSHVAQTDQIFTGLTLLNAGDRTALVSLEVFNAAGVLRGTTFLELKPGVKVARLLSELLSDSFTQAGGFIRVRSNQPVFGFELFGAQSLEYLSAVPPQISVF